MTLLIPFYRWRNWESWQLNSILHHMGINPGDPHCRGHSIKCYPVVTHLFRCTCLILHPEDGECMKTFIEPLLCVRYSRNMLEQCYLEKTEAVGKGCCIFPSPGVSTDFSLKASRAAFWAFCITICISYESAPTFPDKELWPEDMSGLAKWHPAFRCLLSRLWCSSYLIQQPALLGFEWMCISCWVRNEGLHS